MKEKDIVVCLPGFNNSDEDEEILLKGGTGYEEGLVCQIKYFTDNNRIIWTVEDDRGIWTQAVRLATDIEIQAFEKGITNIKNIIYEPEYY